AKANGYDTKTLRKVVSLRKKPAEERDEEEALLDTYLAALGMLPGA
ncbi:MAG: GapR family DNA-binding domain-containing protein, partial [Pseudomonadota bacterium]